MSDQERSFTATSFQAYLDEGKLMGSRCVETGEIFVPPRPICPHTYSTNMEWVELSGKGKLVAYTSVYIGTTPMVEAGYDRKNPYCSGVVELAEGPRFSAQITGVDAAHPETIHIGQALAAGFVERGEGETRHAHLIFEAV
ncbi:MAG: Zn-ribbon domain-containing OB-fold protein [Chloroflexota bacterium]